MGSERERSRLSSLSLSSRSLTPRYRCVPPSNRSPCPFHYITFHSTCPFHVTAVPPSKYSPCPSLPSHVSIPRSRCTSLESFTVSIPVHSTCSIPFHVSVPRYRCVPPSARATHRRVHPIPCQCHSFQSTVVLFWCPIFVPLLKYLQQDHEYVSQVCT